MNAIVDGGPSRTGPRKDNGKRKADDDFGVLKQLKREIKLVSYTDLFDIAKKIYLDAGGRFLIENPLRESSSNGKDSQ